MNEKSVDTSMIEAAQDEDPHLFSSLINLPTFAKNGDKVNVRLIFYKISLKHQVNYLRLKTD